MISDNIKKIKTAISGNKMMENLSEVSSFHRIQGSEGYRNSAKYCFDLLNDYGIDAEILEYKADYNEKFLTMNSFEEWNCKKAYCNLKYPYDVVLSDYDTDSLSIFQKSFSCDYRKEQVEVILIESEPNEIDESLDLKGKMVFLRKNFNNYLKILIEEKGVLGIITDFTSEIEELREKDDSNILKYHTFWWQSDNKDNKPFGFVIDHNKGNLLAEICRDVSDKFNAGESKLKYPTINCFVDSEFKKGTFENVTASIKGQTDEEILLIAHLCHPKASANDNASGVVAVIEAINTISKLVRSGSLRVPYRSIRMLLVPEYTGTYAYLESNKENHHKIKAGLNLDMVGGNQALGYGPLILSGLPNSTPSFVMDLAEIVFEECLNELDGFGDSYKVPSINSFVSGFTTGSDNFILSDPSIGIPTPMLSQWPDLYYHTSGDTVDVISKKMLEKSSSIAASYAYTLADLDKLDLHQIMNKCYTNMNLLLSKLSTKIELGSASEHEITHGFDYIVDNRKKAVRDINRFFSTSDEIRKMVENTVNNMEKIAHSYWSSKNYDINHISNFNQIDSCITDNLKPKRNYIGPINNISEYLMLNNDVRESVDETLKMLRERFKNPYFAELMIQYHVNNENSVRDIVKRVIIDCNSGDEESVVGYIKLFYEASLISFDEDFMNF